MDVTEKGSVQVFEGEVKISSTTDICSKDFSVETERFSPLQDKSIMFYFKAKGYKKSQSANYHSGRSIPFYFSLALVKSSDSKHCYSSLVMNVDVSVNYSDGHLFKKYEPQSNIKVDHMDTLDFEKVMVMGHTIHHERLQRGRLTVLYRMTFNNDIPKTDLGKSVRSSSLKFSNNLKCVYESAVFNDFVFNVADKAFPVHRVILVAHSPVFMEMMTQDFKESKTNSVNITDTTPEIFEIFLKYLYCGEIEDKSWPSVKDLYCLAVKYKVGILKNDCTDIVISLLSLDLVCEILQLAYIYDDSNIKSAAKIFSVNHIKELIPREDWNKLVVVRPIIGYEVIVSFVPT